LLVGGICTRTGIVENVLEDSFAIVNIKRMLVGWIGELRGIRTRANPITATNKGLNGTQLAIGNVISERLANIARNRAFSFGRRVVARGLSG
jgi:hypothetical protein